VKALKRKEKERESFGLGGGEKRMKKKNFNNKRIEDDFDEERKYTSFYAATASACMEKLFLSAFFFI
jgi:hypothetical protein